MYTSRALWLCSAYSSVDDHDVKYDCEFRREEIDLTSMRHKFSYHRQSVASFIFANSGLVSWNGHGIPFLFACACEANARSTLLRLYLER